MYRNRGLSGQLKIVSVLAFLIIISVFMLYYSISGSPEMNISNNGGHKSKYIEIETFKVEPSEFKLSENGTLILTIRNLVMHKINITVKFETHKNVKIFLGEKLLPKEGGNYTFSMSLEPGEKREIPFTIKATMDIGDYERGYYIKAYIFVNNTLVTSVETIFKVVRK